METDPMMVKRKALLSVLEQCQEALESLDSAGRNPNSAAEVDDDEEGEEGGGSGRNEPSDDDSETDEVNFSNDPLSMIRFLLVSGWICEISTKVMCSKKLCDLVKSKIEAPNFLEKLGSMNMSVMDSIHADESSSWDMVTAKDLWEDKDISGEMEADQDSYVLVSQDDIMEGIACFISAYLVSLKQTNDVTPNQLQNALSKTFSVKKKKSKLQKAWDGSKVIYNVASWSATAIGIYQNPALFGVASTAFWTSCRVVSKLL
ncbi:uncharacterized protein M6B38_146200 [Iris pallida]|uniref:Uncharacterized protein n=1 Tax=Iris pallida TaxID=29817 RepID=A0AAX6F9A2_IRIPA|nr:uncharacterized protein M6B38_146200 [Iris pallida]